ncbi:MAG: D-alanine--D-alanine ligase [Bacteroidota bacterium]
MAKSNLTSNNNNQQKKNIAIIAGGDSSEIEISIKSSYQVAKSLDQNNYNVYVIRISKDSWVGISDNIKDIPVNKSDFSLKINDKTITFDCAFIMIHGTPGENGILQSYFELTGIPYTTGGVYSSALTFNKYATKIFLKEYGIFVAHTLRIQENESFDTAEIIKETGLPCFVKPNQGGSSFGISKVNHEDDLPSAIATAFKEDTEILIESYIPGTEVTCGIYQANGKEVVLPVTEIIPQTDFFDYEAKYQGLSEEITPARIPEEETAQCQALTSHLYKILNCRGIVRMDYILNNGSFYFLEVNTVPGMSENSIIPQQLHAAGLNATNVYSELIEDSIIKHQKR